MGELSVNSIHHGDCLDVFKNHIPDESIDLIYLDPPFNTGQRRTLAANSYSDTWPTIREYVSWIRARMIELHRILKQTGSIYLHCDHHASHYLKVMMDGVFGIENFRDEIIWYYQTSSGSPRKTLIRNHDTIYRYSRGCPTDVTWNAPRVVWPESTLRKWQRDETGATYRTNGSKRYYIDPAGKLMDDVWHITFTSRSSEHLGYPTQKPEALLERIITASSNPGDLVLDPFCGSGTTLAVAQRLGRRWVGIDTSRQAVEMARKRIESLLGRDLDLFGGY